MPLKKLCTNASALLSFVATQFLHMLKKFLVVLTCIVPNSGWLFAQQFVLESGRWSDMSNRSMRTAATTITIDSSLITLSQGPTNLYLEIRKQGRSGNLYTYEVLDPNDLAGTAQFDPEELLFDYRMGQFWLRYYIETISRPDQESLREEAPDSSTSREDTVATTDDQKIYETADVLPEFPGGKDAMDLWITQNLKYPAAAKKQNIKGLVTVTAVVEKDGSLSEVKVKKDIGGGCGEEAVRVVKLMPSWIPGMIRNEDKRVRITLSLFFPPKQ